MEANNPGVQGNIDSVNKQICEQVATVTSTEVEKIPENITVAIKEVANQIATGCPFNTENIEKEMSDGVTPEGIEQVTTAINEIASNTTATPYNYTVPMLIFASLGVLALLFSLWLKALDKRKGYGLELPNIKE